MHRSASYYLQSSSSSPLTAIGTTTAAPGPSSTAGAMDVDQLPTYDPRSDVAKKEALDASRADLARTLVHLIPAVVLLCGLLLWALSNTTNFPGRCPSGARRQPHDCCPCKDNDTKQWIYIELERVGYDERDRGFGSYRKGSWYKKKVVVEK